MSVYYTITEGVRTPHRRLKQAFWLMIAAVDLVGLYVLLYRSDLIVRGL